VVKDTIRKSWLIWSQLQKGSTNVKVRFVDWSFPDPCCLSNGRFPHRINAQWEPSTAGQVKGERLGASTRNNTTQQSTVRNRIGEREWAFNSLYFLK